LAIYNERKGETIEPIDNHNNKQTETMKNPGNSRKPALTQQREGLGEETRK